MHYKKKFKLNTYKIKEYPGVVREYFVQGKNKKQAWNNFDVGKIIARKPDYYFDNWQQITIEKTHEH